MWQGWSPGWAAGRRVTSPAAWGRSGACRPDSHGPDREQALATIALRYFRSHGPTTRQDFAGWTGLTAADARRGIAGAGDQLATVRVNGTEMYLDPALLEMPPPASRPGEVL